MKLSVQQILVAYSAFLSAALAVVLLMGADQALFIRKSFATIITTV